MTAPELVLWVDGAPATFATRGERAWKDRLASQIPSPALGGAEWAFASLLWSSRSHRQVIHWT
jgi:hypothetical protein